MDDDQPYWEVSWIVPSLNTNGSLTYRYIPVQRLESGVSDLNSKFFYSFDDAIKYAERYHDDDRICVIDQAEPLTAGPEPKRLVVKFPSNSYQGHGYTKMFVLSWLNPNSWIEMTTQEFNQFEWQLVYGDILFEMVKTFGSTTYYDSKYPRNKPLEEL